MKNRGFIKDKIKRYKELKADIKYRELKLEEIEENILPGFEMTQEEENILPGFEDTTQDDEEDAVLPGFDNDSYEDEEETILQPTLLFQ